MARAVSLLGWLVVVVGVGLATAGPAQADKFDRTLDFSLHGRVGRFDAGGLGLRAGTDTPTLVADADPRLVGRGANVDTVLRANLSLRGLRFGVGVGVRGVKGLRLGRDRLPPGFHIDHGLVAGLPLETFVGYAFGSARHVRPFVEVRAATTIMIAQAHLVSDDLGDLGRFDVHRATFELVGRAGVLIPLGEFFFADASIGRTIVGPGGWIGSVGIGIPIPTANL